MGSSTWSQAHQLAIGASSNPLMWSWGDAKQFVEQAVAFSTDALHVVMGVLLLVIASLILRRSISNWLPLAIVAIVAAVNEVVDLRADQWPERNIQYGESVKDWALTLFLPAVLGLCVRFCPRLFSQHRTSADSDRTGADAGSG